MELHINRTWINDRNDREILVGDRVRIDDDEYGIHCEGTVIFILKDPVWEPMGGYFKVKKDDGETLDEEIASFALAKVIEVI